MVVGPESNIDRVGEQLTDTWKSVNLTPRVANASTCGVSISPPKQPRSVQPRSSATTKRMFGRLAALLLEMFNAPAEVAEVELLHQRFDHWSVSGLLRLWS